MPVEFASPVVEILVRGCRQSRFGKRDRGDRSGSHLQNIIEQHRIFQHRQLIRRMVDRDVAIGETGFQILFFSSKLPFFDLSNFSYGASRRSASFGNNIGFHEPHISYQVCPVIVPGRPRRTDAIPSSFPNERSASLRPPGL